MNIHRRTRNGDRSVVDKKTIIVDVGKIIVIDVYVTGAHHDHGIRRAVHNKVIVKFAYAVVRDL
jgi:hypothetical protein